MLDKLPLSKQVLIAYKIAITVVVYHLIIGLIHPFLGLPLPSF